VDQEITMAEDVPGTPAKTVDEYLAGIPEETRLALEHLRTAIKAAAPEAEEVISYGVPTYKYHGPLVHFVARSRFCSFIVVSKRVLETLGSELSSFDISGTTIHFTAKNPLPAALVKKIVRARMAENETRAKK
jgi:uncharacterized protein YdhG (YjbR/CyaY superfamily)